MTDDIISTLRSWRRDDEDVTSPVNQSSSAGLPLPGFYAGYTACASEPGRYPYTRGISAEGYLREPWVMGMYSGYATPAETNLRFKELLEAGQSGLSIALDLPTQIGIDSDHPLAKGEIGKVGVPINSVEDMRTLLDGLPLERVKQMRTTANAVGPIFAAYVTVALEELGAEVGQVRLFLQNDPLKEFTARGTWIFPPAHSLKFSVDCIEHFARNHPTWQPIQFCAYHVRDAGGTAVEEVAVATANGIAYMDEAVRRGISPAAIAPNLFLFLSAGVDIFEEAAKFRAARRLWARLLHERYGVPEEAASMKIFAYTLGGALYPEQPQNNIVRVAYEALSAVLGGAQTLATSSWDEAHALPSPEAAKLSLRTQQILAHEAGARKVVDPLGGSYYVENLTDRLEAAIIRETLGIFEHGGPLEAISSGYISRMLDASAFRQHDEIATGNRLIVGHNFNRQDGGEQWGDDAAAPSPVDEAKVVAELQAMKRNRDTDRLVRALTALQGVARSGANTIPALIEAARARATTGEMTEALASVWGRHGSAIQRDT